MDMRYRLYKNIFLHHFSTTLSLFIHLFVSLASAATTTTTNLLYVYIS